MPKQTKPLFTPTERNALLALIAIAEASPEGEGDYQDFDYRAMNRAREKLQDMQVDAPAQNTSNAQKKS